MIAATIALIRRTITKIFHCVIKKIDLLSQKNDGQIRPMNFTTRRTNILHIFYTIP